MKSFNLDEAKAGALFCSPTSDPSRLTYKYVGLMSDGRIAFERSDGILACQTAGNLRMVPRTVEGAVNVYRNHAGEFIIGSLHDTYSIARSRGMSGAHRDEYIGTAAVKWQE